MPDYFVMIYVLLLDTSLCDVLKKIAMFNLRLCDKKDENIFFFVIHKT